MSDQTGHKWVFRTRFKRHAFGWRSQPAITRIKEAVAEIKKTFRQDPLLGAQGAVLLLEKLSPALEQVDSSSGAIGGAVNAAIEALVPIIAKAPAEEELRDTWLERLWLAVQEDKIPYIELLPEHWGELCVTTGCASRWADRFIDRVRLSWSGDSKYSGYYEGTSACLSSLFTAGRHDELLELFDRARHRFWNDRQWGVKALAAAGKYDEALAYAEATRGLNENPVSIALACEEILLSCGRAEEAYTRYAVEANRKTAYLATFRTIMKKYPHKNPKDVLDDLVASAPGDEGKWFAAAKSAGLYREALDLANRTPCDPKTLIRAAIDMETRESAFAIEFGITALKWLVKGYGYDITSMDVWEAYRHTMNAAELAGCKKETYERIRTLVAGDTKGDRFVLKTLGRELLLSTP